MDGFCVDTERRHARCLQTNQPPDRIKPPQHRCDAVLALSIVHAGDNKLNALYVFLCIVAYATGKPVSGWGGSSYMCVYPRLDIYSNIITP